MNGQDSFRGQIREGDQVRIENVEGELTMPEAATGEREWQGWFTLPEGHTVDVGSEFELVLNDGRSSRITVSHVRSSSEGESAVEFRGLSRLK